MLVGVSVSVLVGVFVGVLVGVVVGVFVGVFVGVLVGVFVGVGKQPGVSNPKLNCSRRSAVARISCPRGELLLIL